ncbi:thyroglobulin [Huso huso]|uniref:Thyroglobulin n=1 Tax=Huso huso TaxID=61971 RepID=A0ABR1A2E7_HUSHU
MGYLESTAVFLCCVSLSLAAISGFLVISEYQLESQPLSQCELKREGSLVQGGHIPQCLEDGRYRNAQCNRNSSSCWCVNATGDEVPGSRRNGSVVLCSSFCQLHRQQVLLRGDVTYIPQCSNSGDYETGQCNTVLKQCWCVDAEGMEIYGTRQNGKLDRCPGSCEVRERRLLHGVGEKSPPQCSAEGEFLPVQCKFINTTDMMVFDLLHTFNRFPGIFQTFSGFRKMFPEVSGYCFCADSRGRELAGTGLELLLNEVYDTAFSGFNPGHSFTQSNMYRILQRRFLGVQLAMSGRFRCPTGCETERSMAVQTGSVFVPSCGENGNYKPMQCQDGGQCWCVDSSGKEIFGSRQQGGIPVCGNSDKDCPSERRQALSRLFYGPAGFFSQHDIFSTPEAGDENLVKPLSPCSPDLKELFVKSGLLLSLPEFSKSNVEVVLGEVIRGMFPSKEMALKALRLTTTPKRLQENLFGGKFLKNVGQFNFTGAVGPRGTFSFKQIFQQVGLTEKTNGEDFVLLAKLFSSEDDSLLIKQEILKLDQKIRDGFGRDVNLKENQNLVKLVGSVLENEQFFTTVRDIISFFRTEETEDLGSLFQAVFQSAKAGVCDGDSSGTFVPQCSTNGEFEEVQCLGSECWCVDPQGKEIPGSRVPGKRPRCPSKCEKERETAKLIKASQAAGSEVFIPRCETDGSFKSIQCSGKSCFCMLGTGIEGTRTTLGEPLQCPTACQLTAAQQFLSTVQSLLSESSPVSHLSDVYIPQCNLDGSWREVQCDGPPEQVFQFYHEWVNQNNAGQELPAMDIIDKIRGYQKLPETLTSFKAFVKELYNAGHQKVFPVFSRYETFGDVPLEVLAGDDSSISGSTVLFNPLAFWRLLVGNSTFYPGQLSDFSVALGHFQLRQCWCVDGNGQMMAGTKALVNEVPKCPGPCSLVNQQVVQFLQEAEEIITVSNSSHFPLGYSFLLANSLQLTQSELLHRIESFKSGGSFSDILQSSSDYAVRLAAHTTLHFYWQTHSASAFRQGDGFLLGFRPYTPQCNGLGHWEPTQCSESTGHCWCVDEDGNYIPGSLVSRLVQLPQCGTTCRRARSKALLSDWRQAGSEPSATDTNLLNPSCQEVWDSHMFVIENGAFSVLQRGEGGHAWCVNPSTGKTLQPADQSMDGSSQCPSWCELLKSQALSWDAAIGYVPECQENEGSFSPVQCDQTGKDCWCVFENGEEVPGTRGNQTAGYKPVCDSPQCPLPFSEPLVYNGIVLCKDVISNGQRKQQCQLSCRQGYHSTLPGDSFLCDVASGTWVSAAPHPHACQRPQVFQTAQAQAEFQLLLAKGKACSSERFNLHTTILEDLRVQGFCHLQVSSFGESSSVWICDNSAVSIECLDTDRLRAEITWKARLEDIPTSALPDLHDIEYTFVNENLVNRFVALIKRGTHQLSLDSQPLLNTTSFSLGCAPGYSRLPGLRGCAICAAGTSASSDVCSPCPHGSYQDQEGSGSCIECPAGRTTVSRGAFKPTHCVTACQASSVGLECNEKGQYKASQRDAVSEKWFCVTENGEQLNWTEAVKPLTDSQCNVLQKFEDVPQSQRMLDAADAVIIGSETSDSDLQNLLMQCISDCADNVTCDYLTVYGEGTVAHCDMYSSAETNIVCTTSGKSKGFLGNPEADTFENLTCSLKVQSNGGPGLAVYRKKGHEFTTGSQRILKRTAFRKAAAGVYRAVVFTAGGAVLSDVHRFCRDACNQETCCDGFMLNQNILNGGTAMCGLLSSPDVLLCNEQDWNDAAQRGGAGVCAGGIKYNKQQKQFTFSLGGQNFTITDAHLPPSSKNNSDYQASLISFQRVYLWEDSNMHVRPKSAPECSSIVLRDQRTVALSDAVKEAFTLIDSSTIRVDPLQAVPSHHYWIFKSEYSAEQAQTWCLKRCEEEEFCKVTDLQDNATLHFTCTLYPDTQACGAYDKTVRQACSLVLPVAPQTVYRKKILLTGSVKNFYSRLPFRKLLAYSVRNRVNQTGRSITEGFFECERHCDEDSCCKGFGFVRDAQSPGKKVLCLTMNSVGVQTCSEKGKSSWRVRDCETSKAETEVYPFGWYQKPVNQWNQNPSMCPPFHLPPASQNLIQSNWEILDASSVITDPSLSMYDTVHISRDISEDFNGTRDWCLSACTASQSCATVSMEVRPDAVRCILYPDTQTCTPGPQGQECRLLLTEPGHLVYRRKDSEPALTSVFILSHGVLHGEARLTSVGSDWKTVSHFLGIPYAAPPTGANRFNSPQPPQWTGSWNAAYTRPSCLQPGDGKDQIPAAEEDCLYLNVLVPKGIVRNASVLVFFHNPAGEPSSDGQNLMGGSYLAAVGNIIVVTVNFRVGAFGFFSTASNGNFGLQDQTAALKWVQRNIASFGGDPKQVTLAADRSGADIASVHLTSPVSDGLFQRALLMGGSSFSPAAVMSKKRAEELGASLASEVSCSSAVPEELLACLRDVPALQLNAAQTKLLAVRGPFQAWGPVVDGVSVQEHPTSALHNSRFHKVDLMVGTSAEDGLISRAKHIKKFEELQGRTNSKTAFYEALTNSLGGENGNLFVQAAAAWFYSMQHSPSPSGYNVFSRALENATRDHFIICPSVKMASFWADNTRSSVFMYHVPEQVSQTSIDLSVPFDIQLVFGLPHHPKTEQLFTAKERSLSLKTMHYVVNFIKSGNPNHPYTFSTKSFSEILPPWPRFLPHPTGDNYKEFDVSLQNRKGLRKAECSFWSDYIPTLKASTGNIAGAGLQLSEDGDEVLTSPTEQSKLFDMFRTSVTQSKPKSEKDAYN